MHARPMHAALAVTRMRKALQRICKANVSKVNKRNPKLALGAWSSRLHA